MTKSQTAPFPSTLDGETQARDETAERTLATLIKLNNDSVGAYQMAADLLHDEEQVALCREFAAQHNRFSNELAQLQSKRGGFVPEIETMAGLVQEAWMNMHTWVSGDKEAILTECDRADELAIDYYREALNRSLPEEVKDLVQKQRKQLEAEHGRIHQVAAQAQS
ncbi:MAG TPA: PA2169 family four-helix-bundle protein [Caldilineaceae bacterium]|nr:PA2169 family four-helix-bundle protein [Caldilineaceae bacterium]